MAVEADQDVAPGGVDRRCPPRHLDLSPLRLRQPGPAPHRAGARGLDDRRLGLRHRGRRVGVRGRRGAPGRHLGRGPPPPHGVRLTDRFGSRRPPPAQDGPHRQRPAPRRAGRRGDDLPVHRRPGRRHPRRRDAALGRRVRLPPGPDGLDAVTHPPPRRAHRRERGVEHDREPRLLRRPGARGAARVDHERGGRVPPQRRHLPALRGPGVGHPPRPRPDSRRRGGRRRGRRATGPARRSAPSPRWPAASRTSATTATW